ncbi:hypothetical protein Ahy_A02g007542 [Arachis hypogaea]|uniref:Transposase MuDR plant domain-containing protein n=1 Tax=Arachis hypogaea TaxID=3818 RepID=A0A445ECQ0_ARAHY|nr:hypothetical protein Ahy_A02g007542 [Arachis hypogaea]
MTFVELQNSLCQSIENDILRRVQHPKIELYVEFKNIEADMIQHYSNMKDDRDEVYKGMNSDNEDDFEATYEAVEEDKDGDVGSEVVVKNIVVSPTVSQLMDVSPFIHSLDLDAMHPPKFLEYTNIGVADSEEGEFKIGVEYSSRKLVIIAIRSYIISRGVDYNVYESKPQTFYAKCKTYGRWRHTCTVGTISQDHFKLDSNTVVEAIRPLVETNPSMKVQLYHQLPKDLFDKAEVDSQSFWWSERILPSFAIVVLDNGSEDVWLNCANKNMTLSQTVSRYNTAHSRVLIHASECSSIAS